MINAFLFILYLCACGYIGHASAKLMVVGYPLTGTFNFIAFITVTSILISRKGRVL